MEYMAACCLHHSSLRVLNDNDDRVATKEQLGDVSLSVLWPCSLPLAFLRHLRPHLKHGLQNHVHVAVEGLDIAEQLSVVAAVNEDLAVGLDGLGKQGKWPLVENLLVRRMLLLLLLFGSLCINHLVFFCR